jgi:hypothetical protein
MPIPRKKGKTRRTLRSNKPFDTSEIRALGKQLAKHQASTPQTNTFDASQKTAIVLLAVGLLLIIGLGIAYVLVPGK